MFPVTEPRRATGGVTGPMIVLAFISVFVVDFCFGVVFLVGRLFGRIHVIRGICGCVGWEGVLTIVFWGADVRKVAVFST